MIMNHTEQNKGDLLMIKSNFSLSKKITHFDELNFSYVMHLSKLFYCKPVYHLDCQFRENKTKLKLNQALS